MSDFQQIDRMPKFVDEKTVSMDYGLGLSWLRQARLSGKGPEFLKVGRKVLYEVTKLDEFMDRSRRASTSEG